MDGEVSRHIYLGTDMHVEVVLDDQEVITVRIQNSEDSRVPELGERAGLSFEAGAARLLVDWWRERSDRVQHQAHEPIRVSVSI